MAFDFELILVLATVVAGLLSGLHHWRRRGLGEDDPPPRDPLGMIDLGRSLFPVLLVVLVIRSFIVEPFRIPSESMVPTLLQGDFILVNKFAYGIDLPVTHQELIGTGEPQRGDVAVFRYPQDPNQNYIKRIVGQPGDRVRYTDKRLYINGEPVPQTRMGTDPERPRATIYREQLGEDWHQLLRYASDRSDNGAVVVPQGSYFVMGDNRDRSRDSRIWGFVPRENLVGEAFLIWFHWDFPSADLRWSRIGTIVN